MNFKKLFFAGFALLSFVACNQDEEMNNGQGSINHGEGAYMSLSIAMPSANGTRAINTGETTEAGTEDEQKISKLLVLVYDAETTSLMVGKEFDGKALRPDKPNAAGTSNITTYTVPPFEVSQGKKKVVVIVNPSSDFSTTSTLASMRIAITDMDADKVAAISTAVSTTKEGTTATGFLMTNANFEVNQDNNGKTITINASENGKFFDDGSVYVNVEGTKANPTTVTIPVERVVAKIQDETTSYEKTVENTENKDKVVFSEIALINGNKSYFPIKNIRQSGEQNDGTNDYVVDNNFSNQSIDNVGTYFYSYDFSKANENNSDIKFQQLKDDNVIYTLENTMTAREQKNCFTTGVYYKATYYKGSSTSKADTDDGSGITQPVNLYKYAGVLYTFTELQAAADDLNLKLSEGLSDDSGFDDFEKLGVIKYTNGVCYYPYYIRHIPSENTMDVMEFGVVRNNVYRLTINTVSGIGFPKPETPDETPDETTDVMLQIMVQVLPWTVRNNQIDF